MNTRNIRSIWTRWSLLRQSTAVIARKLKLKECDVDSVIALHMNKRYLKREKPFGKESA